MNVDLENLTLAAAQGDRDAYGHLVDETSSLVSAIALAIVRDLEMSRDVAQDLFLAAWRDLKNLRNPASFLPWLRQTTRNRAKAALRGHSRRRRLGIPGLLDDLLPLVTDPRPSVRDKMIAEEEYQALNEALSSLPEDTREVLTLFHREGQSAAQVASLLELSETAVKKRLSRARASLRESLQDRVGEVIRRTAPGAAFTAAVVAALPLAAPPTAAAASLTASKITGGSWVVGLAKLLAPLSGFLAGGLGGVLGVLLGARRWLQDAQDEEERRALRCHTWVSVVMVLFYAAALPLTFLWTQNPWSIIVWFVCFITSLAVLRHVWLPRVVRHRMDAEMLRNPEWAAARRRRERRQAILGWTLGIGFGSMGVAVGLWSVLHR